MSTESNVTTEDGWFIGEDKDFVFTITSGAAAQDITGWTIQWALSATLSGSAILTKTASLTTPLAGVATVSVLSADTLALTPQTYWYRLRRTNAGGRAEIAYGTAELRDVYVD